MDVIPSPPVPKTNEKTSLITVFPRFNDKKTPKLSKANPSVLTPVAQSLSQSLSMSSATSFVPYQKARA